MSKETVKIVNYKQASYYIANGVKPIDVFYTNKIVFVFAKEDTKDVWLKWSKHKNEF